MAIVFTYRPREAFDLCHYVQASEKEHGIQCVMLRETTDHREYTVEHIKTVKTIISGKQCKRVAFLHISVPGKAFCLFDDEKYKIVLPAKVYIKLLEFFSNDYHLVMKRMDDEGEALKNKKDWIIAKQGTSFRGLADIVATLQLDSGNSYTLELVITRRLDINKTNIVLAYSDDSMGLVNLPPGPMLQLASIYSAPNALQIYKEQGQSKKLRQL